MTALIDTTTPLAPDLPDLGRDVLAALATLGQADAAEWTLAACRNTQVPAGPGVTPGLPSVTELFFSEAIPDIIAAKAICRSCSLTEVCLAGAAERREPNGVWGGELFKDGKVVTRKRPRGRPPKDPAKRLWA